jgi:hypothetical protein
MHLPESPVKGQILITQRAAEGTLTYASPQLRQTAAGTILIGGSHEHAGLDDCSSLEVIQRIVADAVALIPDLAHLKLVRSWGALQVMSPDGAPVYQRSDKYKEAFGVCCHSGVSVAAALLYLGSLAVRLHPVSGEPRASLCHIGVCFECLVCIGGQHEQRACLRQVMPNMCIETMTTDENQSVEGLYP